MRDIAQGLLPGDGTFSDESVRFDGVVAHLLGMQAPVVIAMEDLHWADQKSLDWLKFIGRRIAQLPVFLVGTYRDDEVDATHPLRTVLGVLPAQSVLRLALQPLSLEAVRTLAQSGDWQAEDLHAVTSGNPFFVSELVSAGDPHGALPGSVSDAVNARLNGLPQELQSFLEALLGQGSDAPPLDRIVHHAQGAQDEGAVLKYAPLSARKAVEYGAHREAALYLRAALCCLDAAPERLAAAINEAIAILEREAPGAAGRRAKAFALRAQFHMLQDRMEEAGDWGARALELARAAGDREIQAHALNTIGAARQFRGDRSGEAMLKESLDIDLAEGFHEQAARVYTNLSGCLTEVPDLDRAEALVEQGIAFDTAHDLNAWTYDLVGRKAQLRFEQGRYDEAAMIAENVLGRDGQNAERRQGRCRGHTRCGPSADVRL